MRMIAPRTGADEITIAENQTEFRPLVGALYRHPDDHPDFPGAPFVVTRWQFTDAELTRLVGVSVEELAALRGARRGEDLYIAHLTFGGRFQPLAPQIGPDGYAVGPDGVIS